MITLYIVSTLFLIIVDNINMLVKNIFKLKNLKFSALILLSACIENAPLDSLSPEGPYARSIDELFWLTFLDSCSHICNCTRRFTSLCFCF